MSTAHALSLAALLAASGAGAQSDALLQEVAHARDQAAQAGYRELDSGGYDTWRGPGANDGQLSQFEPAVYHAGNSYLVVVFVDDCSYCDIRVMWADDNGSRKDLPAEVTRAGGMSMSTVYSEQKVEAFGHIQTYVDSPTHHYTYGLLFSKPSY